MSEENNSQGSTRPDAASPTPSSSPAPDPVRLLRLAATCPRCGARPAMRVTEALVRAMQREDAETRIATYQCQRRGCGAVYDIAAAAALKAG